MYRIYSFFLIIIFQNLYFSQSINHFHIPDSLKNNDFSQLQKSYDQAFRIDNDKAELYANTILYKGKKEKNNTLIYDGYYKIAHIKGLKNENGHPYADTLLSITRNINTKEYPAKGNIIKGILFNYKFKYNQALNQYIQAQALSKNKNQDQFYYIKKLIGILKTATGENEEATALFFEYFQYEKRKINTINKDVKNYIGSIFSLSNAYSKNKMYQQSKLYNKMGIAECKRYNDYTHYYYFIMSDGIADYYLKNYINASKNLLITEKKLLKNSDYGNLSIVYYYLGKLNSEINNENIAVQYFIKSDSLSTVSNDFEPIIRDEYEFLIDYYKKNGNEEKQLKYIDKLFYADSLMNINRQYLSKEIYKKYDTPILFERKEELIADLNNKNLLLYWFLGIGSLIILVLCYIYVKNKGRIKEFQKQAELLLEKSEKQSIILTSSNGDIPNKIFREEKPRNILSDEKLQDIKLKLEKFELHREFLRKNITIDNLAKELETNRDYLSKSVNELKKKNFSQYLNELRINYIVDELNSNIKLRKYTIAAIADDLGYNNSESFSNAFRKITGTLPSYYIKVLQEQTIIKNTEN